MTANASLIAAVARDTRRATLDAVIALVLEQQATCSDDPAYAELDVLLATLRTLRGETSPSPSVWHLPQEVGR